MDTIRGSNGLDTDLAPHFVWPDLGQTVYKSYQQTTLRDTELIRKSKFCEVNLSSLFENFNIIKRHTNYM